MSSVFASSLSTHDGEESGSAAGMASEHDMEIPPNASISALLSTHEGSPGIRETLILLSGIRQSACRCPPDTYPTRTGGARHFMLSVRRRLREAGVSWLRVCGHAHTESVDLLQPRPPSDSRGPTPLLVLSDTHGDECYTLPSHRVCQVHVRPVCVAASSTVLIQPCPLYIKAVHLAKSP